LKIAVAAYPLSFRSAAPQPLQGTFSLSLQIWERGMVEKLSGDHDNKIQDIMIGFRVIPF
jgi:hypothetical protein